MSAVSLPEQPAEAATQRPPSSQGAKPTEGVLHVFVPAVHRRTCQLLMASRGCSKTKPLSSDDVLKQRPCQSLARWGRASQPRRCMSRLCQGFSRDPKGEGGEKGSGTREQLARSLLLDPGLGIGARGRLSSQDHDRHQAHFGDSSKERASRRETTQESHRVKSSKDRSRGWCTGYVHCPPSHNKKPLW